MNTRCKYLFRAGRLSSWQLPRDITFCLWLLRSLINIFYRCLHFPSLLNSWKFPMSLLSTHRVHCSRKTREDISCKRKLIQKCCKESNFQFQWQEHTLLMILSNVLEYTFYRNRQNHSLHSSKWVLLDKENRRYFPSNIQSNKSDI